MALRALLVIWLSVSVLGSVSAFLDLVSVAPATNEVLLYAGGLPLRLLPIVWLAGYGVFIWWLWSACGRRDAVAPGALGCTPGEAVGGALVPVGGLFLVQRTLDRLWRASAPPSEDAPRGSGAVSMFGVVGLLVVAAAVFGRVMQARLVDPGSYLSALITWSDLTPAEARWQALYTLIVNASSAGGLTYLLVTLGAIEHRQRRAPTRSRTAGADRGPAVAPARPATGWPRVDFLLPVLAVAIGSLFAVSTAVLVGRRAGLDRCVLQVRRLPISIFLEGGIGERERRDIRAALESMPEVEAVAYESRQEAFRNFKRLFADQPELVRNVTPRSLPESFRVTLRATGDRLRVRKEVWKLRGVDEVRDVAAIAPRACASVSTR